MLYVISDPKFTPPADLIAKSAAEEVFMKEYYDRTGLHWRHYFGPDGPRPAPTLFMWPASAVGDIYTVESEHGYWWGFAQSIFSNMSTATAEEMHARF